MSSKVKASISSVCCEIEASVFVLDHIVAQIHEETSKHMKRLSSSERNLSYLFLLVVSNPWGGIPGGIADAGGASFTSSTSTSKMRFWKGNPFGPACSL